MIRLAIVDDDQMLLGLMAEFLNEQPQMEVCLTATGGHDFLLQLEQHLADLPDVLLLDLRMKKGDGIETLEKLTERKIALPVVVLSSHYQPVYLDYMLKMGVSAFIPKDTNKEKLPDIIREVHESGHYFTREQISALKSVKPPKRPEGLLADSRDKLSEREIEVLRQICRQKTAREIAESLFISVRTVDIHRARLLEKTGAKNTAGLIIFAIKNKIADPDDLIYDLKF